MNRLLELVCPAGTPAALRGAIDAGADTVYLGFRDETNARNFPGLNFNRDELQDGIRYAHDRGRQIFVAINTFPRAGNPEACNPMVRHSAIAVLEARDSEPPRKIAALPDLRHRLAASTVTLGRDS